MSRAPLIAGNWKMHKTQREAAELVREMLEGFSKAPRVDDREVLVCPPATSLATVHAALQKAPASRVQLGCQNLCWAEKGAFTGEISAAMARDAGCSHAIIGHSERRTIFGETDDMCCKKVRAAIDWGLTAILCVGESLDEHEAGETRTKVGRQIRAAVEALSENDAAKLVIAYEPIWAIGTGKNETPPDANMTIGFIRGVLAEKLGESTARGIRILYGGSVKPDNIDSFMAQSDIDGALVGGASLESASFLRIVGFK